MRRCIPNISEQCGRLIRRKQWKLPAAWPWPVKQAQGDELLQKLKGSQPVATPSAWVAHLEEESTNREEYVNSEDPDSIKGITKEFIVCLSRAVKDAQQVEKHCYHCGSPDHFIHNCPLVMASRVDSPLNWRKRIAPKKGA